MGMTENLLSASQLIVTGFIFLVILVAAVRGIDWAEFRRDQALQHSFFGAAVVLGFVWQLRAGISPGLSIHVFGMTLITLMMGWRLAILSGLLALVITVITGREPLVAFAANGLVTVMVPALGAQTRFPQFLRLHFLLWFFRGGYFGGRGGRGDVPDAVVCRSVHLRRADPRVSALSSPVYDPGGVRERCLRNRPDGVPPGSANDTGSTALSLNGRWPRIQSVTGYASANASEASAAGFADACSVPGLLRTHCRRARSVPAGCVPTPFPPPMGVLHGLPVGRPVG